MTPLDQLRGAYPLLTWCQRRRGSVTYYTGTDANGHRLVVVRVSDGERQVQVRLRLPYIGELGEFGDYGFTVVAAVKRARSVWAASVREADRALTAGLGGAR